MKQHLWIGFLILAAGCRTSPESRLPTLVPGNTFVKQWQVDLGTGKDPVTALYVRGNAVIAYTASNKTYWMSASGGQLLAANTLVHRDHRLFPPVALSDRFAIPTSVSIESFDKNGKHLQSFRVPTSVQSPGAGIGNAIILGISHTGGGRLARYNVEQSLNLVWEMHTRNGMVAAPAVFNDTVFAGDLEGRVWALTAARIALWSLDNYSFATDGPIIADIAVDDYGVYAASEDKKLYCLDRTSGKIKWAYYAPTPLVEGPVIAGNMVYQLVPNVGLVALNKIEGKAAREATWVQPMARQVLAVDEKYVYVRSGGGIIAALDITTGEPIFQSSRHDLAIFATAVHGSTIYASTRNGTVLAIKPVLKPGTVGELVFEDTILFRNEI